jgi:hypothetical protein
MWHTLASRNSYTALFVNILVLGYISNLLYIILEYSVNFSTKISATSSSPEAVYVAGLNFSPLAAWAPPLVTDEFAGEARATQAPVAVETRLIEKKRLRPSKTQLL